MTVGIGVCCQGGQCVVMAADVKGSFDSPGLIPSHEKLCKQHALPFNMCGNIAGTVEVANAVMNRVATALEYHPSHVPLNLDHVIGAVENARFAELKRIADAKMKEQLGISLADWQGAHKASLLYRRGDRIMRRSVLPVELLVSGVILGNAAVVHFSCGDYARVDDLACIGSGGQTAFAHLMRRGQHAHMSLPRAILHIAEAMREARMEEPATVGPPGDFVVLTAKQTRRMPAKGHVVSRLLQEYEHRDDTEEIDSRDDLFNAVQGAMYLPGVTKEEYEMGMRAPGPRPLAPHRSIGQ
jgi:hypothetical protein